MPLDRVLAIAGGAASAVFYFAIHGGTPGALLITLYAQLPLLMVGLGLGIYPCVIAIATGTVLVGLVVGPWQALTFAAITSAPALIVVKLALQSRPTAGGGVEWYPPGRIIAWLSALCVAVLTAAALYYSTEPDGMEGAARSFLTAAFEQIMQGGPKEQMERLKPVISFMARFYPAVVTTMALFVVVLNAMLAQWMVVQFRRNIRPTPAYSGIELPMWMPVGLIASAALSLISGQIGVFGQNALIVLGAPFFFVGLAVIHSISVGWPGRIAVLVLLYIGLLIFFWSAVLVAGLGLAEPYLALRRRFTGQGRNQEEE